MCYCWFAYYSTHISSRNPFLWLLLKKGIWWNIVLEKDWVCIHFLYARKTVLLVYRGCLKEGIHAIEACNLSEIQDWISESNLPLPKRKNKDQRVLTCSIWQGFLKKKHLEVCRLDAFSAPPDIFMLRDPYKPSCAIPFWEKFHSHPNTFTYIPDIIHPSLPVIPFQWPVFGLDFVSEVGVPHPSHLTGNLTYPRNLSGHHLELGYVFLVPEGRTSPNQWGAPHLYGPQLFLPEDPLLPILGGTGWVLCVNDCLFFGFWAFFWVLGF